MVSKTNWQYPQSLVLRIPVSNPSVKVSSVVENYNKMGNTLPFPGRGAQYPYFHRDVKPGLVSPSIWTVQENILHLNVQQLKAVCLALRSFQEKILNKKNSDSMSQHHCIWLSEQTRGGGGHVPPSLAHLGLLQSLKDPHKRQTYSWLLKCHSQQSLQKGQE